MSFAQRAAIISLLAALTVAANAQVPSALDRAVDDEAAALAAALGDTSLKKSESVRPGRLLRLLEGLDLRLKTFETGNPGELALGCEYSIEKAILRTTSDTAWSLDFAARGNVAFDPDVNPDDFLSTAVRLRWFGTAALAEGEDRGSTQKSIAEVKPAQMAAFDAEQFSALSTELAQLDTAEEVRANRQFAELRRRFFDTYLHALPPELIWDVSLQAALESNQDFSSRQPTLGVLAGGRLVSWNPASVLTQFNLFDYPAAAVRWLASEDEDFAPAGDAWPTLLGGLDFVDAAEDEARAAVTGDDTFLRLRCEAGMRSRLFETASTVVFLSLGFRYFREFGAPDPVAAADLDEYRHFRASVDFSNGWSVSYTDGRLPIDATNDSSFALGYSIRF